jgi:hypothetical protein
LELLKDFFQPDAPLFETADVDGPVDQLEFSSDFATVRPPGDFISEKVVGNYVPVFDAADFGAAGDFARAVGELFVLEDEIQT